ncbi:hypothetical protein [Flavonifractor plautii]|uniref:hypothetical protein n=1 Tax=Flavonifractor plautii TaxID=292800 RepID=UPI001899087D|nr:hypothetical protein [Flavonifractor plautii]DAL42501.1 MAG TPA_asm: hypothetical protein [Caudoviricetes sp.]
MAKGEKLPVVMASQVGQPSGVAGLDESGKVPHAQLPAMGYILTTEKGQPGGVATLGPDGKVPGEQLPDIGGFYEVEVPPASRKANTLYGLILADYAGGEG